MFDSANSIPKFKFYPPIRLGHFQKTWKLINPTRRNMKEIPMVMLRSAPINTMQNFRTLGQPLLGEKKPDRRERKNAVYNGHYILPAMPKGSSHTSLGPN